MQVKWENHSDHNSKMQVKWENHSDHFLKEEKEKKLLGNLLLELFEKLGVVDKFTGRFVI